jgi:hypothetical protein
VSLGARERQEGKGGGWADMEKKGSKHTNVAGVSKCAGKVVEEVFGEDAGHNLVFSRVSSRT